MARNLSLLLVLGGLILPAGLVTQAADAPDAADARLRDTLRSTMAQLRDAQDQLAALQAAQPAQEKQIAALNDQIAARKKRGIDEQAAADKAQNALKAKAAEQAATIARLSDSLAQWKAAAEKLNAAYHAADAERAKQSAAAAAAARRVTELESHNAALFILGSEILTRYEKFSLGEQFLSKEPFVGRTRVALENQIQDYDEKLLAQRATP